ncbi:MAG: SDR family oxidoreductase [Acidobacteriota bacterium]
MSHEIPPPNRDLDGKVAVVTGGNSGIGLSTALRLRDAGARVAILGRNADTLASAREALGDGAIAVQGDVTRIADLDRLYAETAEQLGRIDVLVANAGATRPVPLTEVDEAFFDEMSDLNFKGAFFTVQRALPHLNDGASVVLVSSICNQLALDGMSVYSAAKAAVRSLARTMSAELVPRRIRVNVLSPGAIATPSTDMSHVPEEVREPFMAMILGKIPLGRLGEPEEMASAIHFLASEASRYIVGAELIADGGQTQLA